MPEIKNKGSVLGGAGIWSGEVVLSKVGFGPIREGNGPGGRTNKGSLDQRSSRALPAPSATPRSPHQAEQESLMQLLHPRKWRTWAPVLTGGTGAAPGVVASKNGWFFQGGVISYSYFACLCACSH